VAAAIAVPLATPVVEAMVARVRLRAMEVVRAAHRVTVAAATAVVHIVLPAMAVAVMVEVTAEVAVDIHQVAVAAGVRQAAVEAADIRRVVIARVWDQGGPDKAGPSALM